MEWSSSLVNRFTSAANGVLIEYKKDPDNPDLFEALMELDRMCLPIEIIPISIPVTADCAQPQRVPHVLPRSNDWMRLSFQGGIRMNAFASVAVTTKAIDQEWKKYTCIDLKFSDFYIHYDAITNNKFPPVHLWLETISEAFGVKGGMIMIFELEIRNSTPPSCTTKLLLDLGFSKDSKDMEIDADCIMHSFDRRSHYLYDINIRIKYIPML
jgi:hypothetical protein